MTGASEGQGPARARRPRRDAEANRERILAVAAAVMMRDGRHVPLAAIAAEAAVGVGTLYRKYADRHLAFGRGMHICLGQYLARANLEEGLHLIAQRITKPKLAGAVSWRPFPGAWGLQTLPIEFTPAPRRD